MRFCTRCDHRLDTTAARQACEAAGHAIEIREQPTWWIKYQVGGRPQCVSSGSDKKKVAEDLLKEREGDVVKGLPITAQVGKLRFEEAAEDLLNEYTHEWQAIACDRAGSHREPSHRRTSAGGA